MSAPQRPFLLFHAPDHFAKTTPEQCAFSCRDERISYAELASRSNKLAHALLHAGVKRGDRVAIFSQQSIHLPVAVFGIQKAGAAYVPVDPLIPAARLQQIIGDTGIEVLISQDARLGELEKVLTEQSPLTALIGIEQGAALSLTHYSWGDIASFDSSLPAVEIDEHDLAYIMMTSGSTGTPKGIMHTHYSGLSYAKLAASTYAVTASDVIGSFAPLHFDISTFAYFAGPLTGATTVLIPEEQLLFPANLLDLVQKEALTLWYSAPFILVQIAQCDLLAGRDFSHLRWVKFGGEVLHPKYLRQLMAQLPGAQFSNVYGPAEVNQCTYQHFSHAPETDDPLPIGQVWEATKALVSDEHDQPVAADREGELLISSPTRMRGYWNKPELNAKVFFTRPGRDGSEDVYYRTGDIVTSNEDGALVFVRRKDQQVKVRGYRVELEDIEAALVSHQIVEEAVAFVTEGPDDNAQIAALVTLREENSGSLKELSRHAASVLPRYAVPSVIKQIAELPRTSSGKINRLAVQEMFASGGLA